MTISDIDYSMTASPGKVLPIAERAHGCYIEAGGRTYLDACGGAMVMLLGHSHPRLVKALERQASELAFTYRFSFRNQPMLDLAERIRRIAPGELEWCFFNSSGSEANESAMHLAVLYWELQGKPGKIEFLSRVTSYHGSTLGALSLSGSRWRAPFELLLQKYATVPNSDTAEEGAAALEAAIQSRGADHVAAVRRQGRGLQSGSVSTGRPVLSLSKWFARLPQRKAQRTRPAAREGRDGSFQGAGGGFDEALDHGLVMIDAKAETQSPVAPVDQDALGDEAFVDVLGVVHVEDEEVAALDAHRR